MGETLPSFINNLANVPGTFLVTLYLRDLRESTCIQIMVPDLKVG